MVVTAYNRRIYVGEAVRSVANQRGVPEPFEVIVITNFDHSFDNGPGLEVRHIKADGSVGEYLHTGLREAKYDVVAFLDDDDLWEKDKLRRVSKVFEEDSVSFYHNQVNYVSTHNNEIRYTRPVEKRGAQDLGAPFKVTRTCDAATVRRLLDAQVDFNLSSMAIRKSFFVPFMDSLTRINATTDGFFFWTALFGRGRLYVDSEKLTRYRVHPFNTSGGGFQAKAHDREGMVNTYKILLGHAKACCPECVAWLELMRDEAELLHAFFSQAPKAHLARKMLKVAGYPPAYRNTLRGRLLGIGAFYLLSKGLASKVYSRFAFTESE